MRSEKVLFSAQLIDARMKHENVFTKYYENKPRENFLASRNITGV